MLYVIFNQDGSIKYLRVGESIQQGDHLSKQLFAAIEDIRNTDYVCSVEFELPNGEINALVGTIDTQDIQAETIDFATVQYDGYTVKFTEAQTYLAGNLKVNLKLVNLQGVIVCTYQVTLKINPTGYSPNDTFITESQYNSLLQSINSKYPTDVASESWVNNVLESYATQDWVNAKGYATQDWVSSRGFALLTDIPTDYVTLDTDQANITGDKTFKGEISIDSLGSLKIWKTPTTAQDAANKGYVDSVVTGSIRFKGTVADLTSLGQITGQVQGDEYWVTSESQYYIWNGTQWSAAGGGIDLSDYYTKSESNARYSLLNGSNTFIGNNGFNGITSFTNNNGHSMVSISKDTTVAMYFYTRNSTDQIINTHPYTLGFENAAPSADRALQLPDESGVLATRTWSENNYVKLTSNQDIYGIKKFIDSIKIGDDVDGHADNYIQLYNQETQSYDILSGGTDGGDFSFPSVNTSFGVAEDLSVLGDAYISGDIIHYDDSEGEDLTFTFPNVGGTFATREWVNSQGFLTSHQSLANYVTLNTAQTITGVKTFSSGMYAIGILPYEVTGITNSLGSSGHEWTRVYAHTIYKGSFKHVQFTTAGQTLYGQTELQYNDVDDTPLKIIFDNDNSFAIDIVDKDNTSYHCYIGLDSSSITHNMKLYLPYDNLGTNNEQTIATQEWVNSQGFLTSHQSLANYVTKTGSNTISATNLFTGQNTFYGGIEIDTSTNNGSLVIVGNSVAGDLIYIADDLERNYYYSLGLENSSPTADVRLALPNEPSSSSTQTKVLATRDWVQNQGYATPSNFVTINTNQTITGDKTFSGLTIFNKVAQFNSDSYYHHTPIEVTVNSSYVMSIFGDGAQYGYYFNVENENPNNEHELTIPAETGTLATREYAQNLLTPSQIGAGATATSIQTAIGTFTGFQFNVGSDRNGLYVFTYGNNMILLPCYGLQVGTEYKTAASLVNSNGNYDVYVLTYRITSEGYLQIYNRAGIIPSGYTAYLFKIKLY